MNFKKIQIKIKINHLIKFNKIYKLMNSAIIPEQIPIQEIPQVQLNNTNINQNIQISSDQLDKSKLLKI